MKVNTWTTKAGNVIKMTTEHITTRTIDTGWSTKEEVKADRIEVREVTVNGEKVFANHSSGAPDRLTHYTTINGKRVMATILIPEDVYADVWGEYDKRQAERLERQMAAEERYHELAESVKSVMYDEE